MPKDSNLYSKLRHAFLEGFRVWRYKCKSCDHEFYSTFQDNVPITRITCISCNDKNALFQGEVFSTILKDL